MKPLVNTVIQSVSNLHLISAMRLVQSVEQPPYIPGFDVVTMDQAAKYFSMQTGMLDSIYKQHRALMRNFTYKLCASDVEPYAIEVEDYGKKFSYKKILFANGVSTTLSYAKQLVFDARALLMFSILICQRRGTTEIGNAGQIFDRLRDYAYKTYTLKDMPNLTPWYCFEFSEGDADNWDEGLISSPFFLSSPRYISKY